MLSRRQAIGSGVSLALTAAGCRAPADLEVRTTDRVALPVPHIRQEKLLCVPTSAAMVLAYYGDPRLPRELKTLAAGQSYDPAAPFDDFSITFYRDLLRGLHRIGYGWAERRFSSTTSGFEQGMATITSTLSEGRPVLVDVSLPNGGTTTGHTFVIRGFDSARREFLIVDPDRPAPGRYALGYDQFASVWNESAYGQADRYMILTSPKPA